MARRRVIEQTSQGYAYPFPTSPTLTPLVPTLSQMPNPSLMGGLITAFQNIFAQATPPIELDTGIELRNMTASMNSLNMGGDAHGGAGSFTYMNERLTLAQTRKQIFSEYDEIEDNFCEATQALCVIADNVCAADSFSEDIVTIVTEDAEVAALFTVMKDILNLDDLLWTRARAIARAGEHFDEVCFDDTGFISRIKPLNPVFIQRNEDNYGLLPFDNAFSQLSADLKEEIPFGKWQILHYRTLLNPDDKYGTGCFFSIRRLAKRLGLIEDALTIARLSRAHQKFVYSIPVDGMGPDDRRKYVNDVKREYRKRRVINPRTQKLDLESNPLAAEDDIYLGTTKENAASVQAIGGDASVGLLADVEYWHKKFFAGLGVPKAYLAEEGETTARATLTEIDVQFARTVHRIQMALQAQIRELFNRALILFGRNPADTQYTLAFPSISLIDELRNWEVENLKLAAAQQFSDMFRPDDKWMLVNYLGMSGEDADEMLAGQQPVMVPGPDGLLYPADANGNPQGYQGAEPEETPEGETSSESLLSRNERRFLREQEFEKWQARVRNIGVMSQRRARREQAAAQHARGLAAMAHIRRHMGRRGWSI